MQKQSEALWKAAQSRMRREPPESCSDVPPEVLAALGSDEPVENADPTKVPAAKSSHSSFSVSGGTTQAVGKSRKTGKGGLERGGVAGAGVGCAEEVGGVGDPCSLVGGQMSDIFGGEQEGAAGKGAGANATACEATAPSEVRGQPSGNGGAEVEVVDKTETDEPVGPGSADDGVAERTREIEQEIVGEEQAGLPENAIDMTNFPEEQPFKGELAEGVGGVAAVVGGGSAPLVSPKPQTGASRFGGGGGGSTVTATTSTRRSPYTRSNSNLNEPATSTSEIPDGIRAGSPAARLAAFPAGTVCVGGRVRRVAAVLADSKLITSPDLSRAKGVGDSNGVGGAAGCLNVNIGDSPKGENGLRDSKASVDSVDDKRSGELGAGKSEGGTIGDCGKEEEEEQESIADDTGRGNNGDVDAPKLSSTSMPTSSAVATSTDGVSSLSSGGIHNQALDKPGDRNDKQGEPDNDDHNLSSETPTHDGVMREPAHMEEGDIFSKPSSGSPGDNAAGARAAAAAPAVAKSESEPPAPAHDGAGMGKGTAEEDRSNGTGEGHTAASQGKDAEESSSSLSAPERKEGQEQDLQRQRHSLATKPFAASGPTATKRAAPAEDAGTNDNGDRDCGGRNDVDHDAKRQRIVSASVKGPAPGSWVLGTKAEVPADRRESTSIERDMKKRGEMG